VAVNGSTIPRAIDELPLVALLACFAEGETVVSDAEELRVKESDRVETVVATLRAMGVAVEPRPDGFAIRGPVPGLHGATVDAHGDHRIGMLAAIAGSLADGETHVEDGAVDVSYPAFWEELARAAGEGAPTR
jgi:3-phosphoshikimate 1-carboxyvinyltransferase